MARQRNGKVEIKQRERLVLLQWNCWGWQKRKAELEFRNSSFRDNQPGVILQEVMCTNSTLSGYRCIRLPKTADGTPSMAVLLVKKALAFAAIDTGQHNEYREIVGARIKKGGSNLLRLLRPRQAERG